MERTDIAIGDLHGHVDALHTILRNLNISDYKLPENTFITFTGDYIDRGNKGRQVISEIRQLEAVNPGQITCLLGNHEVMAIGGYPEFISHPNIKVYRKYSLHGMNGGDAFLEEFGLEEYKDEMSTRGTIGKWMRSLKSYSIVENNGKKILFIHGGIPYTIKNTDDLEKIAKYVEKAEDLQYDPNDKYLGAYGIFWDRTTYRIPQNVIKDFMDPNGIDYLVHGHTPTGGKVSHYNERVFNIDIGMAPVYGANTPEVLIFDRSGWRTQ